MCSATASVRIIGIGSPFTEDRLGLQAVTLLQQEPLLADIPYPLEFEQLDRPGSALIPYLQGGGTVVLIDAMQSGGALGSVLRLDPEALLQQDVTYSSHSMGVAETLSLAKVLGAMPERLLIYGIEAGEGVKISQWYQPLLEYLAQDLALQPNSVSSS